ncbi:hypothetical protein HCN44_003935 [Aphidius gifuensis]|uniref:Serine hydrolase domain-containing protein n=1 Tax=Aphidius gifuensis TaxID=684658 RepID=A0A834XY65_APHGI|nr:hypothetical protein HCN44_003935 [Aphidius gifuensis]
MTTNNKLKASIHGYRQSDVVFRGKLGSLRKSFKQKVDFIFAQAPHIVPPLEQLDNDEENTADAKGWWFNTEDHSFIATEPSDLSVGFQDSLTSIENIFEKEGPFDGVLGFSQGASFVSILCAIQQKKMSSIKFDFAILISGFKSLCQPHQIYYNEKINLPSLHVYGETDKIIPPAMAKDLAESFDDSQVVVHEGGHFVAGKKHIYNEFITKMYDNKQQIN